MCARMLNLSCKLASGGLLRNVTCAHGWQDGGGLCIWDGGTATLTDTNVYKNQANTVCSPVDPSLSSHPAPHWNVTCAHGWQAGGGLYIDNEGTATLTDTNVYKNRATDVDQGDQVRSPVEPC